MENDNLINAIAKLTNTVSDLTEEIRQIRENGVALTNKYTTFIVGDNEETDIEPLLITNNPKDTSLYSVKNASGLYHAKAYETPQALQDDYKKLVAKLPELEKILKSTHCESKADKYHQTTNEAVALLKSKQMYSRRNHLIVLNEFTRRNY